MGHYTTEALIPVVLGLRAAGLPFDAPEDWRWTTLGFALALVVVLNKALNDMVHVARAHAGLSRLEDKKGGVTVPGRRLLARLRGAARFVPFHRLYHSVELTMLVVLASLVGLVVGQPTADRALLTVLLPLSVLALVGHFVAILSSRRVRS